MPIELVLFVDVDCGVPKHVKHGKVSLVSNVTYYGATALYSCDPNYELDGVSRRLCLDNGTWSSDTPVCRGKFSKSFVFSVTCVSTPRVSVYKLTCF